MPVSIILILGAIIAILALVSLFPNAGNYPLLSVAMLLAGIALVVLGYGGR